MALSGVELALLMRASFNEMESRVDAAILTGKLDTNGEQAAYIEGLRDAVIMAEAFTGLAPFPEGVELPEGFNDLM